MIPIKQCKKCKQDIHVDARICHYCKSNQYAFDDIKGWAVLILCIFVIGGSILGTELIKINRAEDNQREISDKNVIVVNNMTSGFGLTFERMQDKAYSDVYVVAEVENKSGLEIANATIQFVFTNEEAKLVDVINGNSGVMKVGEKKLIKVSGRAIKPNDQYKAIRPVILNIWAK